MSVPVIAFFNNKGGVGKTSLVYHLAWMFSDHGVRVLAADLDPQANLTVAFLDEERLEELWGDDEARATVYGSVEPLKLGVGDVTEPEVLSVGEPHLFDAEPHPHLLVGDLALARFESDVAETWPKCLDRDARAFRVTSAFWRVLQLGATKAAAEFVLLDLGPNLGAINRAALIACDFVVMPLSPDLFSLQGLKNLGPTLTEWRRQWEQRLRENPDPELSLPSGRMEPAGYVVLQHSVRLDRPVKAYDKWIARIPSVYRTEVLGQSAEGVPSGVADDPNCLGLLKHYRSLMPMAQEANKPMFFLKPADGAIGAHQDAVKEVYRDFAALAGAIARRTGVRWSSEAA
jgi:cellulose biosynthesis protein BcsQ